MVDVFFYACRRRSESVKHVELIPRDIHNSRWYHTRLGDLLGIVITEDEIPESRLSGVLASSVEDLADEFQGEYHRF